MSEQIKYSMYENFPYEKHKNIGKKNRFQWKFFRLKTKLKTYFLKRKLTKNSIADVRVDFSKMTDFRADLFPESGPQPWLDRPDAEQAIALKIQRGEITEAEGKLARDFREKGYIILNEFFDSAKLDNLWAHYEEKIYKGEVPVEIYQKEHGDLFLGRCLNPHFQVPRLKELTHDPRLIRLMSVLLGIKAIPFQTITGHAGSQQGAHSDSIHMTTYPMGYLTAVWIAFEDIHEDSGPLEYYPKSHSLPYMLSSDLINEPIDINYKRQSWYSDVYEKATIELVQKHKLEQKFFVCKKGDILIWHANLIHGGSKRKNMNLSRKAMVGHYFGEGVFCYGDRHEMMVDPYQG